MASREPASPPSASPLLVVLSGPSGVGKDAALSRMRELGHPFHFTITATTRPRRPNERDGVDYIFLTPQQFDRMVERNEFLEWAQVYGHRYGVPKEQVRQALQRGKDVIIKADVQGATTIRRMVPDALLIFLTAPSLEELEARLRQRKSEGGVDLELRMRTARAELGHAPSFDYVVVNHDGRLDEAVAEIAGLIDREERRIPPRIVRL